MLRQRLLAGVDGDAGDALQTGEKLREAAGAAMLAALRTPPYNLVLHTAPLRERVDTTFHWHWELHPRLREVAGLELGTGLPVNPIGPEEAVEELLATLAPAVSAGRSGG